MHLSLFEALSSADAAPFSNYNVAIRRDSTVSGPYNDINQLNERAKDIVRIIIGSLVPKDECPNLINSITKILLAFIWQQHEFNVAEFILENMFSHIDSIHALPYGMWLTSIFQFFSVELDDETFIPPGEPIKASPLDNTPQIPPLNDKIAGTSEAWNPVTDQSLLTRLTNMESSLHSLQLDIASLKESIYTQNAIVQSEHANIIGR